MTVSINEKEWEDNYALAYNHYRQYGNLHIKKSFKTKDGVTYDKDGVPLGIWLSNQRKKIKRGELPEEQRKKLTNIGLNSRKKMTISAWKDVYELAKNYYLYYGNLEVPLNFKTKDGYSYDENGYYLGSWIIRQREVYKSGKMIESRKALLDTIEMRFSIKYNTLPWCQKYAYAKEYYYSNGNLKVRYSYKTADGYSLGKWISQLRKSYSNGTLSEENIKSLNEIGMIWNVSINSMKVDLLCEKYHIDRNAIKKNISYQELLAKITYLLSNGFCFNLCEKIYSITNMSSANLKNIYGINLSEMISIYYPLGEKNEEVKENMLVKKAKP